MLRAIAMSTRLSFATLQRRWLRRLRPASLVIDVPARAWDEPTATPVLFKADRCSIVGDAQAEALCTIGCFFDSQVTADHASGLATMFVERTLRVHHHPQAPAES